jgi:hypothetical protein
MNNYIVIFKPSECKWFRWLGAFGHICLLIQDTDGIWVGIDPCMTGYTIRVLNPNVVEIIKNSYTHVELLDYNTNKWRFGIPMLQTCTGIAKSLLGIKNIFIFTPKQLYNYLKRGRYAYFRDDNKQDE